MVPIFEQGEGRGIGYTYNSFLRHFLNICEGHLYNGNAKSFAFIFYNFDDRAIHDILKNKDGFTRLDRLSGKDLSIFYIHSKNEELIKSFNNIFLEAFEIENKNNLPFVLFFNIVDKEPTDVVIVELNQANILFAFEELYRILENYIERIKNNSVVKINPRVNKVKEFIQTVKNITLERLIKNLVDSVGQNLFM